MLRFIYSGKYDVHLICTCIPFALDHITAGKVCHIYGDPHFHTFDEDFYSFQGDCTYVAVETCKDPPEGSPPFTLLIHNDALIPEERFTYLTMVRLHFAGNTYKLKYTGEILVNDYNFAQSLPYSNDHIEITKSGKYIVSTHIY